MQYGIRLGDLVSPVTMKRGIVVGIVTHIASASKWTGEPVFTVRWLGELDFCDEYLEKELNILSRGAKNDNKNK